jgi:hypothetical protein
MWNERGGWGFVRSRGPGPGGPTVTTLHVHCTASAGNLNCDLSTGTPLQAAAMTSAPVVAPSWVIPPDKVIFDEDIVVGDLLGEGSFGAVHKAHHQGAVCVLKVRPGASEPHSGDSATALPVARGTGPGALRWACVWVSVCGSPCGRVCGP